ncbi:biliverdin-producing heme oxygenase [Sphingomonas sp. AOB5]|uniref:biliverdin-producing heme oxygenase n=1 Tax=Sphingomonas sp. AOB5 TaxID=3034017 RepID=UPI0023F8139D|nr:biliverdin-producing heme oxygenase [Sphingomonas sp. AOB5]MDF7777217.1 biliverdin-producing heme oxygenase [Sphingomonas sp. AOB5]
MNPAHKALRDATATSHDRVDAAFGGFDLTDRDSYAAFLRAHAEAFLPVEAALDAAGAERITDDWEGRKRGHLIREDLAFLRDPNTRHPSESWDLHEAGSDGAAKDPSLRWGDGNGSMSDAAIAGTLYVLEGSRLGGKFLARQLPPHFPRAYLDADQPSGNWRKLLDRLDAILYQPEALAEAIAAAQAAFDAFERSGNSWLKERSCPNANLKST